MIDRIFKFEHADGVPRPTHAPPLDPVRDAVLALAKETERWLRMAIENGPGWNVWRSAAETKAGDPFVIIHRFALVPPDTKTVGSGVLYTQPELTPGERARLLAGRHDWREDQWEDDCGVLDCGHDCCERARP